MATRVVKQAVIPDSQFDWQKLFLFISKVLVSLVIVSLFSLAYLKINQPDFLPITKVRAQGEFVHLTEAMLVSRASDIRGGYFNIDVRQIQQNIETLPWVKSASVRRAWPDTLIISVKEQRATASWHDKGLISEQGKLFFPQRNTFPAGLPVLSGPEGMHVPLIQQYHSMQEILLLAGLEIQAMDMDARRAITLVLSNGLKIFLGREQQQKRLKRFVRIYNRILGTQIEQLKQVDMRYTNGFTILRKQ